MKILLSFVLLTFSISGISQSPATMYFDQQLKPANKKQAVYFGTIEMENGLYKLTTYHIKKKDQLASVGYYIDSSREVQTGEFKNFREDGSRIGIGNYVNGKNDGLWKIYHPTGKISQEIMFNNGKLLKRTDYYDFTETRQRMVTVEDAIKNNFHTTLYDQQGQLITEEDFAEDYSDIILDPDSACSYKDGREEWLRYFSKSVSVQFNKLTDEDYGTVLIRFMINTDGDLTNIRALNMPNSMLAKIAIKAIEKSPKWIPAEHEGKKVKSIRVQPYTMVKRGF